MASRSTNGRRPAFRLPSRRTRFIFYAVGISLLLIFNIWAANNALQHHRVRVPYSPFFVQQIKAGNVESITSTGTAIQGRLKPRGQGRLGRRGRLATSRPRSRPLPTRRSSTGCSRRTRSRSTREPLQRQAPFWERFVAGVVPTILFLLLLYWLFRKMTGGVASAGSDAPAPRATSRPRRRSRSPRSRASTRRRPS